MNTHNVTLEVIKDFVIEHGHKCELHQGHAIITVEVYNPRIDETTSAELHVKTLTEAAEVLGY